MSDLCQIEIIAGNADDPGMCGSVWILPEKGNEQDGNADGDGDGARNRSVKPFFFPGQLHTISTTNNYKTSWDGDDGDDAYCLYLFYNLNYKLKC